MVGLLLACGVAIVLSVAIRSVAIPPAEVVSAITRHVMPWTMDGSTSGLRDRIEWEFRLPRDVLGLLTAVIGACFFHYLLRRTGRADA